MRKTCSLPKSLTRRWSQWCAQTEERRLAIHNISVPGSTCVQVPDRLRAAQHQTIAVQISPSPFHKLSCGRAQAIAFASEIEKLQRDLTDYITRPSFIGVERRTRPSPMWICSR